jgi:F-type H+-transporting ATPase subunit alpha
LLERAAKLSARLGGGSLTAMPIAETDMGNLSGYIPTNLISIADGQIVLDAALFAANQRPAVDVGLSVSRVGGKAQHPALRTVSGRLRLDYAQFLELEMFSRFGGLTDAHVAGKIARGERIRALIAQPRFKPLRTLDEIALLAALSEGVFDGVPPAIAAEARSQLVDQLPGGGMASGWADAPLDAPTQAGLVTAVRELVQRLTLQATLQAPNGAAPAGSAK